MRANRFGAFALCVATGCGGGEVPDPDSALATDTDTVAAPHWALSDTFLPIAHRGGALVGPENTIEAIEVSVAAGAKVVEFDLFETADGVLVLLHDETVDRTTDGVGDVRELTLAEVQALDAGFTFSLDDGATFPFRGQGVAVPTLDAVFDRFPDLYFDVEIKQDDPPIYDHVVETIEAHGLKDQVFIAAFTDSTVQAFRADYPDWITNFGDDEWNTFVSTELDDDYVPPGQIAQIPYWIYSQAIVEKAEKHGIKLHTWTVNSDVNAAAMIDEGVHGIITDDPAMLLGLVAQAGVEAI